MLAGAVVATGLFAFLVDLPCLLWARFIPVWDLSSHYGWTVAFARGLAAGSLYPRWSADANLGLGEPSFYYYAPLTYLVSAGIDHLCRDPWLSLRLAVMLANWVAGLVVLALVPTRRFWRGLAGAFAVQACPMAFLVLAFNGAFAWAMALPSCALALLLYARHVPDRMSGAMPSRPRADAGTPGARSRAAHACALLPRPGLAVAYAAVCLTHILSGFMLGLAIAAAEAAWLLRRRSLARLAEALATGGSLLLGAALAGVYLVPALLTLPLVSPAAITAGAAMDWHSTFAFAAVTALLYGVRWKLYQYPVAAVLVLPLVAGPWRRVRAGDGRPATLEDTEARLLVAGAGALFFALEISAPLWILLPPLHLVQFSYRFLAPASIAGLLALAWRLAHSEARERLLGSVLAVSLLCVLGLQLKLARDGQAIAFGPMRPAQLFSDGTMFPAVHGPDWQRYGKEGGLEGACGRLALRCETLRAQPQSRLWRVLRAPGAAGTVALPLPAFAFPSWSAVVDGVVQPRRVEADTGALVATLAALDSMVELRWAPLPQERVGWALSAAAGLTIVLLGVLRARAEPAGA